MSKITAAILAFFAIFAIWRFNGSFTEEPIIPAKITPTESLQAAEKASESIFVPYWNIPSSLAGENYDRYFYFGITVDESGVDKNEVGYANIDKFVSAAAGEEKYMTLRMLDSELNLDILKDDVVRRRVIQETLEVARQHGFDGVILDLELSALPFSNVKSQINTFVKEFHTATQEANTRFLVAMYGDVFYRGRPFDMDFIGENSDELLIMAYDFHKSFGEPGPNFPLEGNEVYGYDFKLMVDDFIKYVPAERLSVIFGMYGYDWIVDAKKRPIKRARALSYLDIKSDFIDKCEWKNCLVLPDAKSGETEINYVDSTTADSATNHIIWFEDERSVNLKKTYLQQRGINKTAYWVFGYF